MSETLDVLRNIGVSRISTSETELRCLVHLEDLRSSIDVPGGPESVSGGL